MLIDHTGAVLFPQTMWLRYIGRLAFPIYCFLLTEGFIHTHDLKHYMFRMGIFMLISEIPFDLAFSGTWWDLHSQNVYWTLFLGLAALWIYTRLQSALPVGWSWMAVFSVLVIAAAAWWLQTDYGAFGVLMIFGFYVLKNNKISLSIYETFIYACISWIELYAVFAFFPIFMYNGKRGLSSRWLKYAFYIFYPAHLLVLVLIRTVSGA